VRQLQQPDLLEDVAGALDASGLDPGDLMLEITESVLAADQQAMLERLAGLRALGVHLATDDFGTGYSSLAYLFARPLDQYAVEALLVAEQGRRPAIRPRAPAV
jgi:EAL domain-containing protein (putative c-di-GMP-specific phosphodiesterase class I)